QTPPPPTILSRRSSHHLATLRKLPASRLGFPHAVRIVRTSMAFLGRDTLRRRAKNHAAVVCRSPDRPVCKRSLAERGGNLDSRGVVRSQRAGRRQKRCGAGAALGRKLEHSGTEFGSLHAAGRVPSRQRRRSLHL